ncbi:MULTISPECIES: amino acid synthesis family protein [unclassified Pseudomonas]|uniref:amino acid synthesis family protein n=1 Tax=unclassified Pseudomonas TaxID=196821 RepID=UPI0007031AD8|nr:MULTISPECIES: amino acid synthesis family protein [unclassified Pseudomonas]MBN2991446.1 amino acid synthesis family protein [Pseudomonas cedrina subsp. fulgida]KQM54012.1 peptide synthetase [Pseudomonas sp. Leaf15]MCF5233233.1 amino acid synthesis family protein [Pseudomonas sp. PA-5-4H]MCF5238266.1 amino acid synthesis family protein [Pseudomonas sp. PA-5-4G]MCF5248966.1 amino acid synthesis family protein [Pseudomonas sp. PA-5-4B]
MKTANFASYHIRKWYSFVEETLANETGQLADGEPLFKYAVAAVIDNPYAGRFSQDLAQLVEPSPLLGEEFGRRIQALAGSREIISYGKAILVGSAGEYEHGNALLTNPAADPIRVALGGGKSWVPSTGKRGGPGSTIDVPLAHKDALYVRSHYDSFSLTFGDGPSPDEIVVIWAFATRGRLHARLGGLKAEEVKGLDGLH